MKLVIYYPTLSYLVYDIATAPSLFIHEMCYLAFPVSGLKFGGGYHLRELTLVGVWTYKDY